jgi:hypothetical protein
MDPDVAVTLSVPASQDDGKGGNILSSDKN